MKTQCILDYLKQMKNPKISLGLRHKKLNKYVDILAEMADEDCLNNPDIEVKNIVFFRRNDGD